MSAKPWLCALTVLALSLPVQAADVNNYLPADSEMVLTINIKQLLGSGLIKKHALDQMKAALQSDRAKQVLGPLGFDPLKDVDSIMIAGPGGDEPGKGLIIINGNFDVDKLKASAEAEAKKNDNLKIVKEGSHQLFEVKNPRGRNPLGDTMYMAIAGPKAIVASPDKAYVIKALDKKSGAKAEVGAKMASLLKDADGNQSFWLVALPEGIKKSQVAQDEKIKEVLDKLVGIGFGITLDNDLQVALSVATKDADAADAIKKQINEGIEQGKGLLGVLALNNPDLAPLADFLATLKVNTKQASVNVKGQVPAEAIEKALKRVQR
ncbi:MAG: hypothetical protein AB7K24_20805 [Gemmataceae bacterium]